MRRVVSARQGGLIALMAAAVGILSLSGEPALSAPVCDDPARPQIAESLNDLHQVLGDVMGSPSKCPQVDVGGNTIQETTTGLAVHRADGMSVFVSGDDHWALTALGLETWTGSWHNGLYPPVTPPRDQDESAPAQQPPATVEAMTLVVVRQDRSNTVVLENGRGTMLTVETEGACPDANAALGDSVFMRSAGPKTDLILLEQHETCAVAEMYAAVDN